MRSKGSLFNVGAKEKDNLWVKGESNCKKLTVCGGASIAAYEV